MKKLIDKPSQNTELRRKAEAALSARETQSDAPKVSEADTQRLFHELEVHSIELEMQNEELMQARVLSETALQQYTELYDFAPVGYFSVGRDGEILKLNLSGAELLCNERSKLIDRRFGQFVSMTSRATFATLLGKVFESSQKVRCELALLSEKSEPMWISLEAVCSVSRNVCNIVAIDISERRRAKEIVSDYAMELERRVEERTLALIQSNHVKDEFLANISHELRTPLNSVLGFSEILLEKARGPLNEDQESYVNLIFSSSQHLLGLINDILDVSKMEAGKLEIFPSVISVKEVCESSLSLVKVLAAKKSISIGFTNEESISTLLADPLRLKQILVNMLGNAIKFTPEGGNVMLSVSLDAEHEKIQFLVSDSGIGIAPENIPKLFTPFTQLDSSSTRQYEGTGLGLSLMLKLAELQGGSIQVESESGVGSRFTLILPWTKNPSIQEKGKAVLTHKVVSPIRPAVKFSEGRTVLLAEDNDHYATALNTYLTDNGFMVVVANNGLEAIIMAAEHSPDIILMDIQMPQMDGLETIRRLRAKPKFSTVPIIALTALAMPADRARCFAAGANEYFSKPVSMKLLLKKMSELL